MSRELRSSADEPPSIGRIRDVALRIFAVQGTEATSLRMIANAAGVSIGLVQHYFGTKANLVSAVDDYVMKVLGESLAGPLPSAPANPVAEVADRVTSLIADHVDVIDYLCRALVDSTPMGVRFFDGLVEIGTGHWEELTAQGLTRPGLDPLWLAINPLVLVLGTFMLRSHLDRHLPEPFTTPAQLDRWQRATDNLISSGQLDRPDQRRAEPES
jgi:AcrR family transcriptional regulator